MIKVSEFRPALRQRGDSITRTAQILDAMGILADDRPAAFDQWLAARLGGLAPGISGEAEPLGPRPARRHPAHTGPARQDRPVLRRRAPPGTAGMVGPPWPPARDHPRRCPRRRRAAARPAASDDPGRRPVAVRLGEEERRHLPRPGQPPEGRPDRARRSSSPSCPARSTRLSRRPPPRTPGSSWPWQPCTPPGPRRSAPSSSATPTWATAG